MISPLFVFRSVFPWVPVPIRLPYGGWWVALDDSTSDAIFKGRFETNEWKFVRRFLTSGMTVLDIGAHHGFYAILASKAVGPAGAVIAFEPSPRERRRLGRHLALNRCENVRVEPFALSGRNGEAPFHVAARGESVFNSLRPPGTPGPVREIKVVTRSIDSYLSGARISRVDFVKLDAEGAELDILLGADQLLQGRPRPVVMAEVSDLRTAKWGYPAAKILERPAGLGYEWFVPGVDGFLFPCGHDKDAYNFIAVPEERMEASRHLESREQSH